MLNKATALLGVKFQGRLGIRIQQRSANRKQCAFQNRAGFADDCRAALTIQPVANLALLRARSQS